MYRLVSSYYLCLLELQSFSSLFSKFSVIGIVFIMRVNYISKENHAKKYIYFVQEITQKKHLLYLMLHPYISVCDSFESKYKHKEIPVFPGISV